MKLKTNNNNAKPSKTQHTRGLKPFELNIEWILAAVGILLVLFVLVTVWLIPRSSSDLFISLAGGRDIMAGKLAAPDDWSFSTNGKVWFNQNWGADLIIYLANSAAGDTGLLVLKFLILLAGSLFIVLGMRRFKLPLPVSLLTAAITIVSINMYAIFRPNLFVVVFVPLLFWLLYKAAERPVLIWIAVAVSVVWANVHASFVFGLGMIVLWVVTSMAPDIVSGKWDIVKKKWHLAAGMLVSILLCGLLNPFGFKNLLFPFTMVQDGAWQNITDWRPIWETDVLTHYTSSIFNFLIVIAITLILLLVRTGFVIFHRLKPENNKAEKAGTFAIPQDLRIVLFEILVAAVSIVMAVRANRFITIALLATAPVIARQIGWAIRLIRLSWIPVAAMGCIIFAYAGIIMSDEIRNYDQDNPIMNTGSGSLFEKMHYMSTNYDPKLVKFINSNRISGNIFSPWEWEGYLRWNCPQLRVFMGGRAQQIYDVKTFAQLLYVSGVDIPQYHGTPPEDMLNSINPHLFLSGCAIRDADTILTALNCGNWAIIYSDDHYLLFADTKWPETAELVERLEHDRLAYEDPGIQAISKASLMLSQPKKWDIQKMIGLFENAFDLEPTWSWGYKMIVDTFSKDQDKASYFYKLLAGKLEYLSNINQSGADSEVTALCRIYISSGLYNIASSLGTAKETQNFSDANAKAQLKYFGLQKEWQFLVLR
jgi:hypothetical protein